MITDSLIGLVMVVGTGCSTWNAVNKDWRLRLNMHISCAARSLRPSIIKRFCETLMSKNIVDCEQCAQILCERD